MPEPEPFTTTIERAREGDGAARRHVVEAVSKSVYRVVFALIKEPTAAEDAANEALKRCMKSMPEKLETRTFEGACAWAGGVARNVCRERWRYDRTRAHEADIGDAHAVDDPAQDPERFVAKKVQLDRLREALTQLSTEHVEVLHLFYWQHLTVAQISTHLGCAPGTATSRLHRAKRALFNLLHAGAQHD